MLKYKQNGKRLQEGIDLGNANLHMQLWLKEQLHGDNLANNIAAAATAIGLIMLLAYM